MPASSSIPFPQRPSNAHHVWFTASFALGIYALTRIAADSQDTGFIDWNRPFSTTLIEITGSIVICMLMHEGMWRVRQWAFARYAAAPNTTASAYLLREMSAVFLFVLVAQNALALPFMEFTDDGLSFFDGFVMNIFGIMFTTGYLLITRGRDYVRLLSHAELELERYKHETTSARLQALRSQLNPHFLFNSLNTLSSLVHRDAHAADDFIHQLATVYRYVLEHGEHETVTLREELAFAESYIFLLRTRFKEGLCVCVAVDAAFHDLRLPPMTLQVLIENAVKHNIVSTKQPLTIEITSYAEDCLTVNNNLQERTEKDASSSVGLANIAARYEYLRHDAGQTAHSAPFTTEKTATHFTVRVPLLE